MQDTVNDDLVSDDFKKNSPVAASHAIFRGVVGEPFDIATKIIFKKSQSFDEFDSVLFR